MPVLKAGEKAPLLFRAGGGRRVHLWNGEHITGQILDVDKDTVRLRTAWAARLELPRAAVSSIDSLPGWRTIFDTDFRRRGTRTERGSEGMAAGLKLAGDPAFADAEDGTAARALLLNAAGQGLTYTLPEPLTAGRVGVNFQEQQPARGARWLAELLFQQGERTRRLAVTVAGNGEHFAVDAGGLTGTTRQVARMPGWHRLIVQFSRHSLRMTCDDDVLWYNLENGPGGRLQQVTIACQQSAEGEAVRGGMAWTELCIERAATEHPPPPVEADQDAIRLLDDDQLFGHIVRADRRAIQIEGRFGKRSLPWTRVSGCSFRRPPAPPKAKERAKVRLRLHSGLCPETDALEGVVTKQDERRIVLRHALLGELTLNRDRVRELRKLDNGTK